MQEENTIGASLKNTEQKSVSTFCFGYLTQLTRNKLAVLGSTSPDVIKCRKIFTLSIVATRVY